MTRRHFDENSEHEDSPAEAAASLMCRMPSCRNRWTVDICHGRVCSFHDSALYRASDKARGITTAPEAVRRLSSVLPGRAAVRPYSEPEERDEEDSHVDNA